MGKGRKALCEEEEEEEACSTKALASEHNGLVSRLVLYRNLQQLQCILIRLGYTIAIAVCAAASSYSSSLAMAV